MVKGTNYVPSTIKAAILNGTVSPANEVCILFGMAVIISRRSSEMPLNTCLSRRLTNILVRKVISEVDRKLADRKMQYSSRSKDTADVETETRGSLRKSLDGADGAKLSTHCVRWQKFSIWSELKYLWEILMHLNLPQLLTHISSKWPKSNTAVSITRTFGERNALLETYFTLWSKPHLNPPSKKSSILMLLYGLYHVDAGVEKAQ